MTSPPIPFPAQLDALAPALVLDLLNAEELGAMIRLNIFAWDQEPSCSLPGDISILQRIARLDAAAWERAERHLLLCFERDAQGRWTNPTAFAHKARLSAEHTRRRSAAQVASGARWSRPARESTPPRGGGGGGMRPPDMPDECEPHAPRIRLASDSHSNRIPAASLRPEFLNSAPAPQRSLKSQTNSSAAAPDSSGFAESAGARAPKAASAEHPLLAQLRRAELAYARQLMLNARWPWAGPRHQKLPAKVVDELIVHRNASLRQVEWALAFAAKLENDADALSAGNNPVGRVIGAIERNLEPDLWWAQNYENVQSKQDARLRELRQMVRDAVHAQQSGGPAPSKAATGARS